METQRLSELLGQNAVREKLAILINLAHQRSEALDHLLFCGPDGLGKTTFANGVANEMGVNIKNLSGLNTGRVGDMAAIFTNLRARDILLIEHIEALHKPVIELLISAADEFALDIVIGKGVSARSIRLKLPQFTLIGTTSKPSQVNQQLKNLMLAYDFTDYSVAEISQIILLLAKQYSIICDADAIKLLAENCDGNPGQVSNLLEKINKFAMVYSSGRVTKSVVRDALAVFNR